MRGNAIYIQSGGPTAVVNLSAWGLLKECRKHSEIGRIYAAEHGIVGVIERRIFDLTEGLAEEDLLCSTPAMIFGSCRYEIDEKDPEKKDYSKILKNLQELNIRYLFINGGNGTVRAGLRLGQFLDSRNYPYKLILIPKTVDNDLTCIDHAPGFPSAARHVAITVSELERDMMTYDTGLIVFAEVMGRNTGFLAAAASAAGLIGRGPDLIYVPEVIFDKERFIRDVRQVLSRRGKCFAVVAEGVRTADGAFLFQEGSANRGMDMQKNMGGIIPEVGRLLRSQFDCKIRGIDLGLMQRCSAHDASETDRQEAKELGRQAVSAALEGHSLKMVTINRAAGKRYRAIYGLADLAEAAKADNNLPLNYLNETLNGIQEDFLDYLLPLIGPLPAYAKLDRRYI